MTVMLAMLVGALLILATTIISTNFQPQHEVIANAAVIGYALSSPKKDSTEAPTSIGRGGSAFEKKLFD